MDSPRVTRRSPRVSVITVVRNGLPNLARTIESVATQDYPSVEHIVIDGGSTDGTVELLKSRQRQLAYWTSAPDGGIADAMNKGISASSGELLLFLHADDYLPDPQVLGRALARVDDPRAIWGFDIYMEGSRGRRRCRPRPFNFWTRLKNPLPHQGVLCPRELFERIGLFDTRFSIDMDYEFWLRAYKAGARLERVPEALAVMADNGVSSSRDWNDQLRRFQEERRIQLMHAGSTAWILLYAFYWLPYLGYRRLRSLLAG